MHNGILIGYRVGWSSSGGGSGAVNVGLQAESLNITGLEEYWEYNVYVAGMTNGGVGVTNNKKVMTDDDGKKLSNDIIFTF